MYEQVEKKYQSNPNVVFLSVNTDEDKSKVPPFLNSQNWAQHVYYDAGLGAMLRVASIPTTIVLDQQGQIHSRMAGFIPERFIDMLTQRIEETLHEQSRALLVNPANASHHPATRIASLRLHAQTEFERRILTIYMHDDDRFRQTAGD